MPLSDMRAVYDWGKNLPDTSIIRAALTAPSGAADGNLLDSYNCGMGPAVSQLCADDPSFGMIHRYVASLLVDPAVLGEKSPLPFTHLATTSPSLYPLFSTIPLA